MMILALTLALGWPQQAPAPAAPPAPAPVPAVDAQPANPLMLRFPDGSLLWGHVADHTPEHLAFRRLDNGGLARVPWDLLDPVQAEELMRKYGYVDLSDDEVFVEADRLIVGDSEVVGKIVSREGPDIVVKTSNSLVRVPKLRVTGAATKVKVPALDVYTADELYSDELLSVQPETARDHVELARFCERILEFERAIEHYEQAGALDGAASLDIDLPAAVDLARAKAEAKAELEHLRRIDSLRARKKYDEALALCEEFGELYPSSDLLPEAAKKRQRVERARLETLSEEVQRSWHRWAGKLARTVARDRELDLAAVIGYVDEQMSTDIQQRVLADMRRKLGDSVTLDEVLNAWVSRDSGRWRKASYGYGTWLLGEARALEGLTEDQEAEESLVELTDEQKELAERIKRYLENQKTQRALKTAGGQAEERQQFWMEFPLSSKELWILAYYAENSGDMQLREPSARSCRQCGGTGVREVIHSGAGTSVNRDSRRGSSGRPTSQKIACPTCHHIGIVRRVSYR